MPKWTKVLTISFLALTVTGCKITATNRHNDSDTDHFISGRFYDARDTGRYYPTESWALNTHTDACRGATLYFESSSGRVRVYGSPAYSETSFRAAASELDHRIDGVLSRFQMRWSEFVAARTAAAPYPQHLLGCLSPSVPRSEFASASVAAVSIDPFYGQWPYESGRIISHELTTPFKMLHPAMPVACPIGSKIMLWRIGIWKMLTAPWP